VERAASRRHRRSREEGALRWLILGNPANRRVTGFVDELRQAGQTDVHVLSWRDQLADPAAILRWPDVPTVLRVDSHGEDDAVLGALLALGGAPGAPRHGELLAPSAAHAGLLTALSGLSDALSQRPSWVPMATPAAIAWAFDKRRVHADLSALGVRVAPERPHTSVAALVDAMDGPVFIKLRYGSSASGLAVFATEPRWRLMTTVARHDGGWFNSLRVRRVDDRAAILEVLEMLFAEGVHVEQAIPKMRQDGAFCDLRVLLIAGEPAFHVLRCNRHPITNLHLLGWRGDVAAFRAACPDDVWAAAMADCRRVAAAYDGLHVGLDVLFERGWRGHRILEANAFGDLLPGLVHDGRTVYGAQIATLLQQERR
jgi:hypothetical protein